MCELRNQKTGEKYKFNQFKISEYSYKIVTWLSSPAVADAAEDCGHLVGIRAAAAAADQL
jgi:hypothetical protein